MTLQQKQEIMSKAFKKSQNGELTYVLLRENRSLITQSGHLAFKYVNDYGYKLYATCKDGILTL